MVKIVGDGSSTNTNISIDGKEIPFVKACTVNFHYESAPVATIELLFPLIDTYAIPEYIIQPLDTYPIEFLNKLAGAIQEEIKNRGSV